MTDIAPCPFCGGSKQTLILYWPGWRVVCGCGYWGDSSQTEEDAIAAWNKRADDKTKEAKNENPCEC